MKCPHDGRGDLIKRNSPAINHYHPYGFYDCDLCGREWVVQKDGTMISETCTDREIYDPKTDTLSQFKENEE